MREVGVLEAKTRLSELLDGVEQRGEEVTITRRGKAVAKLSRIGAPLGERRPLTGPELVEKARLLREQIAREDPELAAMSWEDLKKTMHE
jgi:prevent-host-death family protein